MAGANRDRLKRYRVALMLGHVSRRSVLAGLAATPFVGVGRSAVAGGEPPNVLYILVDQLRAQALSIHGETNIHTPNLDSLAKSGVRFSNCFNTQALCVPSRVGLFCGVFPSSLGIEDNFSYPGDVPSLAHAFTDAGYRSAYLGKWHLDAAPTDNYYIAPGWQRRGFDDYWGINRANHDYRRGYLFEDSSTKVRPNPLSRFQTLWYTELAEDYLDQVDGPFLFVVGYGAPHSSMNGTDWFGMIPQGYTDLIDPDALQFRTNVPEWTMDPGSQGTGILSDMGARAYLHTYYAMILALDEMVGRLIRALKYKGLYDNTIIVFTSDHGEMGGSRGLYGKTYLYDEANKVPLFISWPDRLAPDTVIPFPVSHADLFPTLHGLAGLDFAGVTHGRHLVQQITGRGGSPLEDIYIEGKVVDSDVLPIPPGKLFRSVRTPRWYYVERPGGEAAFLQHIPSDPNQEVNLANHPNAAVEQAEMADRLRRWKQRVAARTPDTGSP